jgi:hypothetical protein
MGSMAAPWLNPVDPAPDDDGQRSCAQGNRCASATRVQEPDGDAWVPARGPRAFCAPDRGKIANALAELPRLYVSLAAEIGRPSQGTTTARSPFGPRLPLRGDIDAIMRAYAEVLVAWHERVAVIASLSAPPEPHRDGSPSARPSWYVARAVHVIEPRLDVLLALEPEPMRRAVSLRDLPLMPEGTEGVVRSVYAAVLADLSGADAGLEVLALHRLARSVLGETRQRPVELLGVPCRDPECDMLALRRAELPSDPAEPAWWSECTQCGDRMDEEEYRDWTRRYARWAQGHAGEAGAS